MRGVAVAVQGRVSCREIALNTTPEAVAVQVLPDLKTLPEAI